MYQIKIKKHILHFNVPAGTSRGVLMNKPSWYIILKDAKNPETVGLGECSLLPGLSPDDHPDYETTLREIKYHIGEIPVEQLMNQNLRHWPSIRFGLETALQDLAGGGKRILFPGNFINGSRSIPINGLIWMGTKSEMAKQIEKKLEEGWRCLKLKVGAVDFADELNLLSEIRKIFPPNELEIRVDANGAFEPVTALEKLKQLSDFEIHSIEQPIKPGQWNEMAGLCMNSPVGIALDEELIPLQSKEERNNMLSHIHPEYIILKPSLVGGIASAEEWIELAQKLRIGYWVTSALESNIGLNAIAQWTSTLKNSLPQGLGTGQLYTNNIDSPLTVTPGLLSYLPEKNWDLSFILKK